jgi:hypothetical protein
MLCGCRKNEVLNINSNNNSDNLLNTYYQGLRLLTPWFLQHTSLALKPCCFIYSMEFNPLVSITVVLHSYPILFVFISSFCHAIDTAFCIKLYKDFSVL